MKYVVLCCNVLLVIWLHCAVFLSDSDAPGQLTGRHSAKTYHHSNQPRRPSPHIYSTVALVVPTFLSGVAMGQ